MKAYRYAIEYASNKKHPPYQQVGEWKKTYKEAEECKKDELQRLEEEFYWENKGLIESYHRKVVGSKVEEEDVPDKMEIEGVLSVGEGIERVRYVEVNEENLSETDIIDKFRGLKVKITISLADDTPL